MTLIEAIRTARDEWEWLAIDKGGGIFAYNYKPTMLGGIWIVRDDAWYGSSYYDYIGQHTGTPIPCQKSLIRLTNLKVQ